MLFESQIEFNIYVGISDPNHKFQFLLINYDFENSMGLNQFSSILYFFINITIPLLRPGQHDHTNLPNSKNIS